MMRLDHGRREESVFHWGFVGVRVDVLEFCFLRSIRTRINLLVSEKAFGILSESLVCRSRVNSPRGVQAMRAQLKSTSEEDWRYDVVTLKNGNTEYTYLPDSRHLGFRG